MEGHNFIGGSHKVPSNEYCRDWCMATQPSYSFLHFPTFRVFVNFIHCRNHSNFLKQNVHSIAETTRALGMVSLEKAHSKVVVLLICQVYIKQLPLEIKTVVCDYGLNKLQEDMR
ncbi:hypothetical protein Lal_00000556 [Lupinus albus]|nr:hypothetical protein Lal_00000556 [Lupinus albus]